jgi:hypothetical protein
MAVAPQSEIVKTDDSRHLLPGEAAVRPTRARRFLAMAEQLFLIGLVYVLSIGPLYWDWYRGRFCGGSKLLVAFYEPLVWAAQACPPFGKWMDWYVGLWIT